MSSQTDPQLPEALDVASQPEGQDQTLIAPAEPVEASLSDGVTVISSSDSPPAATALLVQPGVLINDNYRILNLISAGGMGEVYRAENIFTGSPAAIKIILPNLARDQTVIDMFRREARILVQLRDDAIVRYHNFVHDRGLDRYCLIMEFVEGQHLWDRIRNGGALDVAQAFILMRRLARGLAQAHASGVTHRDLSPDNVILRDNLLEEAVVIDFGIARSTEFGDGFSGRFAGKFSFIAPEQLGHGCAEIGPAADIYGLALLIAASLRGTALPMGNNIIAASDARRVIPDLSGIAHRMYPLLQYMLEPDPADRPADMSVVLTILDDSSYLPARYRLPLWAVATTAADEDSGEEHVSSCDLNHTLLPYDSVSLFDDPTPAPVVKTPVNMVILGGLALASLVVVVTGAWLWLAPETEHPSLTESGPSLSGPAALHELPPRQTSTRNGFLGEQPLPDCTLAIRNSTGPDAGKITVWADGPRDHVPLQQAYIAEFGADVSVATTQIDAAQCATVDFARSLLGRSEIPPSLIVDQAELRAPDGQVSGQVRNIMGRTLWLFTVSASGRIYDLSPVLHVQADGTALFAFSPAASVLDSRNMDADAIPGIAVALVSSTPLTSVAAAPAGASAEMLLPLVLAEIQRNGGNAALDLVPLWPPVPAF